MGTLNRGMQGLYAGVGKMMPGAKVNAMTAGKAAFRSAPVGMRKASGQNAMRASYIARGKTPARMGMAAGLIGTSTAMRPNSNESRTSYRGPMQTGRGSGRYA
jgi:hypothetical protein